MTPNGPASPQGSQPETGPGPARSAWAWPVMWIVSVLSVVAGGVFVFHSCTKMPGEALDKTVRLAQQVGQVAQKVAAAFNQGTVTTTFTSYATTLTGSQRLQVATVSQTEVFARKDESSTAFGYIPLPDVIVQATAPVTYTYYLDLKERWDFRLQEGVIYVIAPDLRFNKPAVDASRINYEVKKDSYLRRTSEAMDNLKSSITWLSYQKAKENVSLARETGRRQTESFVQNWVGRAFADGKNYPVKVLFRNETNETMKIQGDLQPIQGR